MQAPIPTAVRQRDKAFNGQGRISYLPVAGLTSFFGSKFLLLGKKLSKRHYNTTFYRLSNKSKNRDFSKLAIFLLKATVLAFWTACLKK